LYAGSFLHSTADVSRLLVGVHQGEPVFLGDIAQVSEGAETPASDVTFYSGAAGEGTRADGAAAVTVAIAKQAGSNGVEIARGMMGPYMAPIPVLGSVAMLFSLFAAFALTPWLTLRLRPALPTLERMRNSILLVDFALHELGRGVPLQEALLNACQARTRPILITALALVGGSVVILTDPIFQGMAVSLLFGVLLSTLLTLAVVPLGCLSIGRAMSACRRRTEACFGAFGATLRPASSRHASANRHAGSAPGAPAPAAASRSTRGFARPPPHARRLAARWPLH
jgi:multidrug efflux pump subunit AcrB